MIPAFGEIANGINGLIYAARGDYVNAGLSFAAMVPFAGWAATAGKFALAAAPLVKAGKNSSNLWKVGRYNKIRGLEKRLDAHHVGQGAGMSRLVPGYDYRTGPAILVPKAGHTEGVGILSRRLKGITNARSLLARDIMELRRVYGHMGIPNSSLERLIQLNKELYPGAFERLAK